MSLRNTSILFLALILLFLSAGHAVAHPASGMVLTYDSTDSVLEVVVDHSVSDLSSHYINKFEVRLDGKKFCELELEQQLSNRNAVALFKLPQLNIGTEIEVEVYCNKFGEKKARITVE